MKFTLKIVLILIVLSFVVAGGYFTFLKTQQPRADMTQAIVSSDGSLETRSAFDDQPRVTEQLAFESLPDQVDRVNPLDSSTSFSAVEAEFLAKAEQGDGPSQRALRQMYEYCFQYSINPETYDQYLASLAQAKPEASAQYERIIGRVRERCEDFDGGEPIPMALLEYWHEKGLASQEITARIRHARTMQLDESEVSALAQEVIASKEPDAFIEFASSANRIRLTGALAELTGSDLDSYAWIAAACRLGKRCDSQSVLMENYCLSLGTCDFSSFEEMVRTGIISARDQLVFSSKVNKIISLTESGK
jgi:hypothetical protein